MGKAHIPEDDRTASTGFGCSHGDRVLSRLLLVVGCLSVVGFVALYRMQLARDTEMEWMRREMEYLREHCAHTHDAKIRDRDGQGKDGLSVATGPKEDPTREGRILEFEKFKGSFIVGSYQRTARDIERSETVVGDYLSANRFRGKRSASIEVSATIKDVHQEKPLKSRRRNKDHKLNNHSTLHDVVSAVKKIERSIKKSRRNSAIHLSVDVNQELMARQRVGAPERLKGQFRGGAFYPNKSIFNIWKPDEWFDGHMYNYHENSGMVKVKQDGIYLIYAQITLHGGTLRRSIAVHVGDDVKPFIEHVSLDRLTRVKRGFSENGTPSTGDELPRYENNDKRARRHSVYNLANMVAVTRVEKDQHVFIKTIDKSPGLIPKPHLTYWGIARLNS